MNVFVTGTVMFFVAALVDAVWAKYIETAAAGKAGQAAFWSGMILTCGTYLTINFIANYWLAIPDIVGAMLGTYLTIKYKDQAKLLWERIWDNED